MKLHYYLPAGEATGRFGPGPAYYIAWAAVALLVLLAAVPAGAENTLKKAVFEDCPLAISEFKKLDSQAQRDFLEYLSRILEMQVSSMRDVVSESAAGPVARPAQGQPNPPGPAPAAGGPDLNLWRVFEPTREIEAKRCALSVMKEAGTGTLFLLPRLLLLAQDSRYPSDLRESIEDTMWQNVLAAAHTPDLQLSDEVLNGLMQQASAAKSYLAENSLIELHSKTVPFLIREMKNPVPRRRSAGIRLLLRIDDEGTEIGAPLMPLLDSAEDALRARVIGILSRLPAMEKELLFAITARLNDPSPAVKSSLYEALNKLIADGPQLNEAEAKQTVEVLMSRMLRETDYRDIIEAGIGVYAVQSPELYSRLAQLAKSADWDIRRRSLRLLSKVGFTGANALELLVDGLYDPVSAVRVASALALGAENGASEQKGFALLRALRSAAGKKDPIAEGQLILAVAQTVQKLDRSAALARLVPYLVDGLAIRERAEADAPGDEEPVMNPAAAALIYIGSDAVKPALKAIKSRDPLIRRRAGHVLSMIKPVEQKAMEPVVGLLRDSEATVRSEAAEMLPNFGPPAVPLLRQAMGWEEREARFGAARALLALGEKDDELRETLLEAFRSSACSEKLDLMPDFKRLEHFDRAPPQQELIDCLAVEQGDRARIISALEQLGPLEPEPASRVQALLNEAGMTASIKLRIIRGEDKLQLPVPAVVSGLVALLQSGDNSVRGRAATILGRMGSQAMEAAPPLQAIFDDPGQETLLKHRVASALALIAPSRIDYGAFFLRELEGEHYTWALASIRRIGPGPALPFLAPALKERPSSRKDLVIKAIGRFGPAAAGQVPDIADALQQRDDARVRYQAMLALLRIDASHPAVYPALRRELIGRYYDRLSREKLPAATEAMLRSIMAAPQSFTEYRAADLLLEKLLQKHQAE